MCGIAGIKLFNRLASKTDEEKLYAALRLQTHRGPDNTNVLLTGNAALGHNRLSIIDTNARSNQPFSDETGRYALVFNGEIYNFHELKAQLSKEGIQFRTTSDTEVLFYLLIRDKAQALQQLRGCFAFAFYDKQEDYMLLARDRMGINPLLYAYEEDCLVFGSELDVFGGLGVNRTISGQAVNYYFQYTYIPAPYTIYQEVQKLLPGHYLELRGAMIQVSSYWNPRGREAYTGTYDEARLELKQRVEFAVTSQLEADVPVGTFLSGGVDSSIVSAVAAAHKQNMHTFSVSFTDQKTYDESPYALMVAQHIKSQHHVIRLGESDFSQHFHDILDAFDEPFADSSAIAMWFLARETTKHLKVALSGDGADELLGGYNKHQAFHRANGYSNLKKGLIQLADNLTHPVTSRLKPGLAHRVRKYNELVQQYWPENYWYLAANIGEKVKNEFLKHPVKAAHMYQHEFTDLNDFLYFDQLFVLPNDMLKKVDLMSMRHSLEVRTPFMDKDLVQFINALPPQFKLNGGQGKMILRDAFRDTLPAEIFTRSKKGFEVPLHAWITRNWKQLVPEDWFSPEFIRRQDIFVTEAVINLKKRFFAGSGTAAQQMWAYFVFQHWYQNKHEHG